jgi:hypothetical protein
MESFGLLRRLYQEQCVPPKTEAPERIELVKRPCTASLQSPSDPDVTYGHKGKGFEVQLAETCEEQNPFQVVTAVALNDANQSDQQQVEPVLSQIERVCGAAPQKVHADCGYGSGDNIVLASDRGTQWLAPIGQNGSEKGVTLSDFGLDHKNRTILCCPIGEVPLAHQTADGRVRLAIFDPEPCRVCPIRSLCPIRLGKEEAVLSFTASEMAIVDRRTEQETVAFKEQHKIRSGIEATNSELKRSHGLAKPRVRRKPRVALSVRLKVLGLNIKRYMAHLCEIAAGTPAPACTC